MQHSLTVKATVQTLTSNAVEIMAFNTMSTTNMRFTAKVSTSRQSISPSLVKIKLQRARPLRSRTTQTVRASATGGSVGFGGVGKMGTLDFPSEVSIRYATTFQTKIFLTTVRPKIHTRVESEL